MKGKVLSCTVALAMALVIGCAGTGRQVPLDIRPSSSAAAPSVARAQGDPVHVAVLPFEDQRPDPTRLGVRRHLGGGATRFTVAGDSAGRLVAEVVAEYLTKKGLRAEIKAQPSADGADVTFTGRLLELAANADSKFMRTDISVTSKIQVEGHNAVDGSTVRMTLNGAGSERVFWFEPEDVERLIKEVLAESLEKLSADTRLDNKALRLK